VAVILLTGAPAAVWFWRSGPGSNLACLPEDFFRLADEIELQDDLEAKVLNLRLVHQRKREIGLGLLAGRLTLREAAAAFAEADLKSPVREAVRHRMYPGLSEEECYYREVLSWVRVELNDRPEEAKAMLTRLQEQLPDQSPKQ
jgi:hypothetical protein